MAASTQSVAIASVTPNSQGGYLATSFTPSAKRIGPSRDCKWEIQRIRLSVTFTNKGYNYLMFSGVHGVAAGSCGFGLWPVAGVWKNTISPENEIQIIRCVPPGKSSYEPQIPVTITSADTVICAIFDGTDFLTSPLGSSDAASGFFTILFQIDVDELGELDLTTGELAAP